MMPIFLGFLYGGLAMCDDYFHWQKKVNLVLQKKEGMFRILFDDFCLHFLMLHPNMEETRKAKRCSSFQLINIVVVGCYIFLEDRVLVIPNCCFQFACGR